MINLIDITRSCKVRFACFFFLLCIIMAVLDRLGGRSEETKFVVESHEFHSGSVTVGAELASLPGDRAKSNHCKKNDWHMIRLIISNERNTSCLKLDRPKPVEGSHSGSSLLRY